MDQQNLLLISKIIKLIRTAINNLRIYPPGSQLVVNTLTQLYSTLNEYLQTKELLTIGEVNHRMIINGEEVKNLEGDSFIVNLLSDFKIHNITFKKNLTIEELSSFIEILSRKKTEQQLQELIKNKNIVNITIDQIKYVAIKEGEEIVKKVSGLVEQLRENPVAFMSSLREIYDSIDKIQDINIKNDMISMLAKKLAAFEPLQLKEFFDRPLPAKIEQSGLKEAVISALPQEKIREIFDEIIMWYEEIKKKASSEFEAAEQLASLRRFLGKILASPEARNIPFRFYEELLRVGVLEELPEWFKKEEPSLILKVDQLLEKDSLSLIDPAIRDALPDLIKQLCQSELSDIAEKLTNKVLENLKQHALKIRSDTMMTLIRIYDVLVAYQKEKIIKNIENAFLPLIGKEKDINIYKNLVDLLEKRVVQLLLNSEYESALSILSLLKQHTSSAVELDKERRDVINEYLTKLAGEISELLISEMKSGIEKRQKYALKIIAIMEDTMSDTLIRIIKESDDYITRKICAVALKNIGENAIKKLLDSIDLSISTTTIRRIIDIFDIIQSDETIDKISQLIDYPDKDVKKMLLRQLQKIGSQEAKNLLIKKLKDKDVVLIAVRILGELKCQEAVDEIIKLAKTDNTALQEEVCIALGTIGDRKAIGVLGELLKGKKSFFSIGKNLVSETVRIRAAWALGNFPGKETEAILKEALKDKNNAIRSVVEKSLNRIKNVIS
ncbi:MAG: HEAT repeat domain-containing protein [Endomicrobiia bacterium]